MKLKKFLISLAIIAILACMNVFADGNLLEVRRYVDEFGDPTEEPYITQGRDQGGKFSNSATTNSRMTWRILVDADSVSFMIDEYGSHRVKGSVGFPDRYTVSVKNPDGEVYRFSGSNSSDRIKLASDDTKLMLGLMATCDDLKISIVEVTRYSSSSYNLGTLDCTGFADLYESLFGEVVWESGNDLPPEDKVSESSTDTSVEDVGGIGGNLDELEDEVSESSDATSVGDGGGADDDSDELEDESSESLDATSVGNGGGADGDSDEPEAEASESLDVASARDAGGTDGDSAGTGYVISEFLSSTSAVDTGSIGGDSDGSDGSDGKNPRFSVSTLVGYAVNLNTDDDLRIGLAASWRAFTDEGFGLDLRADVSVLTLMPGVYPSFDVTAGLMCVCPPIALESTELIFSFGTMLGYARINGAMGETYSPTISYYTIPEGGTNIFLMRFIVEAEVALNDFSIGLDLFFEMPMYSVLYTDYWGYTSGSVDLGFSFIPSLAVKYRF